MEKSKLTGKERELIKRLIKSRVWSHTAIIKSDCHNPEFFRGKYSLSNEINGAITELYRDFDLEEIESEVKKELASQTHMVY